MRYYLLLLFIGFGLCFTSCREDFEFERSSNASLEFSRDTVYLDTVFTNIGSSTYTLKVYNRSDKDIKIPSIHLGQNNDSEYRLMVDGVPGKVFNDVELLAKDSMFIFVETTIDYSKYTNSETTFLYTDNIQFEHTNGTQKVELVTLVQDAVFIKPNRSLPDNIKEKLNLSGYSTNLEGHELTTADELHWTNEKPYVVYGYALVPNGKTLTVDPGARVHFHAGSGLVVDTSGTLNINGGLSSTEALENEVIFEGDRLEPEFSDVAGQWNTLWIFSGENNSINHLTLKNAAVGILMDVLDDVRPRLTINNSQIYNCTDFGILARHAYINGDNLVANNAGQASVALTQGGDYNFRQCTFANYFSAFNQVPLLINDYTETEDAVLVSNLVANFDNCILYGSSNLGLSLENKFPQDVTFKTKFNHCLIKVIDTSNQLRSNPLYPSDANDPEKALYTECIIAKSSINDKPDFLDPQNNILFIGEDSAANGTADAAVATVVGTDILGVSRQSPYDIGAYESIVFTEE
ncbi:hypothetical protein [Flavobacterium sp. AG291]|uniref:hypothetical protein n=1 Tax=Flavobacterium sp. AG291 TaxID=2184000 RepID=UPI000E0B9A00|nr:hypothetical protein [Flavobacterium sp. AG291]RDI07023.1 hypothetical protein DEU42_113122 [Flavobacterium sp. AG291]